jgi:hypothetical protein
MGMANVYQPPPKSLATCRECGTTTGGGEYCWQHAPYTVYPLRDGSFRETRNGLTHVWVESCPSCSALRAELARLKSGEVS